MKILVVSPHYYPEGFSITDLCEEWVRQGHEVLVVTNQPNYGYGRVMDGYENVSDEVIHGVHVHRCRIVPRKQSRLSIIRNYLSFWTNSKRYLRHLKEEFDVVYSMSLSPLIAIVGGTIYAKKRHVRHVLHCLDLWPESMVVTGAIRRGGLPYLLLKHWCKRIYSQLDEILVSSPSFDSYFRVDLNIKELPITYVPQPPQLAAPKDPIVYKSKANLVYAGNIGALQLVENIVSAAALLKNKLDFQIHLIGMGSRSDVVQKRIQEESLQGIVVFHGIQKRDVTAGYYVNATAIIVSLTAKSSVGSTIPSKLNSALYYGRPILGIIQGDGRKVLEEAGGAIFAQDETPEAIAQAIIALSEQSPEEITQMGKNNAAYFHAHYELADIAKQLIRELEK